MNLRVLLCGLLLTAACAKKAAVKNPSNASPSPVETEKKDDTGATNANAPDKADEDQRDPKADPCDGGE